MGEQPIDASSIWDREWRSLTISDLRLSRPYRYAYAWEVEQNTLRIRIEQ